MEKRKLKLVVSDLHLGLGRKLEGGGTNSLEEFYYEEKFVEFLHYYSSGEYKESEVELIINGDFLNFLQVDYNGHYLSVVTEGISLAKLKRIVSGHAKFFAAMKEFAARPGNVITYIVGNHDQAMLWPATRAYLNEVLDTSIRFKNIVYFFDGVHIEHGHMHEASNHLDPRKFFLKNDLPEPILNLPFGSHFFVEFVMRIKLSRPHIDKVRPFKRLVRWLFFNETKFAIKSFAQLFYFFIKSVIKKDPRRHWPVKKLIKVVLESAIFPDLSTAAHRILHDERVHTVVFGHSHVYEYRQWGKDKEYFNTGTWTELTSLDFPNYGKITKLTYVLIEYPIEGGRPRGRLKEWRGYHRIEEDVVVS